jgi:hypothetical protein
MENSKDKVWVLVECIQSYRMRYCVEAPATNPEYALDDVTMQTPKEFSQLALPELIVSHRVVSQEEALHICRVDNEYISSWDDALVIKNMFTKEGETHKDDWKD